VRPKVSGYEVGTVDVLIHGLLFLYGQYQLIYLHNFLIYNENMKVGEKNWLVLISYITTIIIVAGMETPVTGRLVDNIIFMLVKLVVVMV
jgi:hypothetical protein